MQARLCPNRSRQIQRRDPRASPADAARRALFRLAGGDNPIAVSGPFRIRKILHSTGRSLTELLLGRDLPRFHENNRGLARPGYALS